MIKFKSLLVSTLVAVGLPIVTLSGISYADPAPFVANPSPLVAGQTATITVDNTIPNYNTFIVMPGGDFLPSNGNCTTHLKLSTYYLPSNVWNCHDLSAPIIFTSQAVASDDLVANPYYGYMGFGYVGFVSTKGYSRGSWTIQVPVPKFDYLPAASL